MVEFQKLHDQIANQEKDETAKAALNSGCNKLLNKWDDVLIPIEIQLEELMINEEHENRKLCKNVGG